MLQAYAPFIFLSCTILLIILNFLAFIGVLPLLITLPLLFLFIYLTLHTLFFKQYPSQTTHHLFRKRS